MRTTRWLKAVLMACALACLCAGAHAKVTVRGFPSCGDWVEVHERSESFARGGTELWLLGFLTGLSMESGVDALDGTANASLFLWMTNYCKANPLSDTIEGGLKLFDELGKKRKSAK